MLIWVNYYLQNGVLTFLNYAIGEETITQNTTFNQDIKLKQLDNDDSAKKDNISSRAIDYTKRMSINFIGVRNKRS
jgi:hypothetical protein